MKQFTFVLSVILLITSSCKTNISKLDHLSDSKFIEVISYDNATKSIKRIDSLIKTSNYSEHQIGLLYFEKGRNLGVLEKDIEAIGSLKKALSIFEKTKNKKFIAKTNLLLGDSNAFLSKNEKAKEQINIAINIFREIDDKKNVAKALNSIAHVFFQFNDFDTSIAYVKQAAEIQLELKDILELSASYNNIGYILERKEDYKTAKIYYNKAIKLNEKTGRSNSFALQNLGAVHLIQGNIDKCKASYLKALKIENETGKLSIQKDIYDVLLNLSIKEKDFNTSALYIVKRDSVNQLLILTENEEKIKLVEKQYQLIVREKELKQEKKINNKNKIIFISLVTILLFLGLFFLQKNRNKQLRLNQEKLVLEQRVLRSQMNPHFIFNALTSIQKSLLDEDLLKSSTSLARFAKLIRQNFEFTNKKLIGLDEDLNALKNYIDTQQLRFEDKFDYQINIQKELDISYIKIPPMLLQPFIENAIEHGLKSKKEKGKLTITIFENNDLIHFEIIDDGVGYKNKKETDREHANDIFFKRLKLRGFKEEKSFAIQPSLENGKGTKISFALKL